MNDLILLAIVSELEKAEDIPATAKRLGFKLHTREVALNAGFPIPGDDNRVVWHNADWRLLAVSDRRFYGSSDLINFWSPQGARAPEKGFLLSLYQKALDVGPSQMMVYAPIWLLGLASD